MSGAQNGIVGDAMGTDLPHAVLPEQGLLEERAMARFSKTREFKRLKTHLEDRIKFFETQLPSAVAPEQTGKTNAQLGEDWRVANLVIAELRGIIEAYELAKEIVSGKQPLQ